MKIGFQPSRMVLYLDQFNVNPWSNINMIYFTSGDPHRDKLFYCSFWHRIWKYIRHIYIYIYIYGTTPPKPICSYSSLVFTVFFLDFAYKKGSFFWIVAIIKHWFNILKNTNKETNIQKLFGEGPLEKIQQIF